MSVTSVDMACYAVVIFIFVYMLTMIADGLKKIHDLVYQKTERQERRKMIAWLDAHSTFPEDFTPVWESFDTETLKDIYLRQKVKVEHKHGE